MKKYIIVVILIALGGFVIYDDLKVGDKPIDKPVVSEKTYFAEIDSNNIVLRVIVADQEFIDSGAVGNPDNWLETDKVNKIRKNSAGTGYSYNKTLNAFVAPKPTLDATLDTETATWILPELEIQTATST